MTNAELIKALKDAEGYIRYVAPSCIASDEAKEAIRAASDALEAAEKRIEELIPKEGEWIDEQRGRWIYAKCNLCGKVQDVRSNYCPNCGARMRGEHDE